MVEQPGLARAFTYEHDGLTLAYSVVGDGPQPILFVHGATATGAFEWTDGGAVRADLSPLIDHLDMGRPHIVGFSYGAEIALTLELDAPGTARSLVLISPGTGRPSDYRVPRLETLHRRWPFALRRLHEANHGPEHWRDLVTALHEDSVSRPELSDDVLAGVACPILLMAGDRDEPTRQQQARRFAQVNPRARFVEIAGAAHSDHQKCPDTVRGVIGDFLAEVDLERAESHGAVN